MQDAAAKQIYTMEKNMHSSMQQSYETTTRVFGEVLKQVGKLDEGQKFKGIIYVHFQYSKCLNR